MERIRTLRSGELKGMKDLQEGWRIGGRLRFDPEVYKDFEDFVFKIVLG